MSTPSAREEILARIRAVTNQGGPGAPGSPAAKSGDVDAAHASGDVDAAYAALARPYQRAHHDPAATDIVALFADRAADYRAVVERVPPEALPTAIARALTAVSRFVVPDGVPAEWLVPILADSVSGDPGPANAASGGSASDDSRSVGSGSGGSGSGGGRIVRDDPPLSAADLDGIAGVLTGCAIAIAETGTVILDHGPGQGRRALTLIPDFHLVVVRADQVAADLPDAFARLDPARPHTLISGPSATSDIELIRVEGVHGPRNLHILIAG